MNKVACIGSEHLDTRRWAKPPPGDGAFSLVELMAVVAILSILTAVLLPALSRARESARRAVCQSNLKQWGLVYKMYASEASDGLWPPLQAKAKGTNSIIESFSLSPWMDAVYPEYVTDLGLLSCPSDVNSLDWTANGRELKAVLDEEPWIAGRSYAYLGWVLDKADRPEIQASDFPALALLSALLGSTVQLDTVVVNAQLAAGMEALLQAHAAPSLDPAWLQTIADLDIKDVAPHPSTNESLGNGATDTIFRLREGIERFLITDIDNKEAAATAQSAVWVMFDQFETRRDSVIANHQPGGSNVLYMDGHAAYVAYEHGPFDQRLHVWTDGTGVPPVIPSIARTVGAIGTFR